jgi:hypothetical protein
VRYQLAARCSSILSGLSLVVSVLSAQTGAVKGSFVLGGTDALLRNVRATRTVLDDGKTKKPGYAVLLSAKPATGDITE